MFQQSDYHFADSLSSISIKSAGSQEEKNYQQKNQSDDSDVERMKRDNPKLYSSSKYCPEQRLIDSFELRKQQIRQIKQQQSPRFNFEHQVHSEQKLNDSAHLIRELQQRKSRNQNTNILPQQYVQQQQMEKNILRCEECNNLFSNLQNGKICQNCSDKGLDQVNCPYCGDEIVREFAKDHFEDCIAYIEDQFKVLDNQKECSICMGEITTKLKQLNCKHYFHEDCLEDWLKKKKECPVCRQKL